MFIWFDANLATFTTYFLFSYLCAFQRDVRFYAQGQWICGNYLFRNKLQQHMFIWKAKRWGSFSFFAADSDNTSAEYMCPSGHFGQTWSLADACLSPSHLAGLCFLGRVSRLKSWGTHLIPAEGGLWVDDLLWRLKLYHRHHSEWVAWGFAFIRHLNHQARKWIRGQAVSPAGETLQFSSIAGKKLWSPTKCKSKQAGTDLSKVLSHKGTVSCEQKF